MTGGLEVVGAALQIDALRGHLAQPEGGGEARYLTFHPLLETF